MSSSLPFGAISSWGRRSCFRTVFSLSSALSMKAVQPSSFSSYPMKTFFLVLCSGQSVSDLGVGDLQMIFLLWTDHYRGNFRLWEQKNFYSWHLWGFQIECLTFLLKHGLTSGMKKWPGLLTQSLPYTPFAWTEPIMLPEALQSTKQAGRLLESSAGGRFPRNLTEHKLELTLECQWGWKGPLSQQNHIQ